MHKDAWLPRPAFSLTGLSLFLSLVPPGRNMEVTVPTTLNVLNGSDARLACTFNSCYTVNHKQFSLNWTYQECSNCSEEMFLQFRMKIINLKLERFRDRVEFSGNPGKYDLSSLLSARMHLVAASEKTHEWDMGSTPSLEQPCQARG
ncbi:sodium voltage-gated channel beta subunit 2 [Phyllostomus discolor]|uniref:Sodium voltage-gated channel beta subunit 2 n=1 Tax=Phyllostomus discolor TaxID=89673 RepID=A0A834A741_9CHIR|nr:sodium voltage-gated channel beta subunit 2 [Phyllostomus discolor]